MATEEETILSYNFYYTCEPTEDIIVALTEGEVLYTCYCDKEKDWNKMLALTSKRIMIYYYTSALFSSYKNCLNIPYNSIYAWNVNLSKSYIEIWSKKEYFILGIPSSTNIQQVDKIISTGVLK